MAQFSPALAAVMGPQAPVLLPRTGVPGLGAPWANAFGQVPAPAAASVSYPGVAVGPPMPNLAAPVAAAVAPQVAGGGISILPQTREAFGNAYADASRYNAQGDVIRGLGAGIRTLATAPAALVRDLTPGAGALHAAQSLIGGIVGSDGSTAVTPAAATMPVAAHVAPGTPVAQVVGQALDQGRTGPATGVAGAQQQILDAVSSVLSKPWRIKDLQAAAGVLPDVAQLAAATTKTPRGRDIATATAMDDYNKVLVGQLQAAQAQQEKDPIGARASINKAWADHAKAMAAMAGASPMASATADMLEQAQGN